MYRKFFAWEENFNRLKTAGNWILLRVMDFCTKKAEKEDFPQSKRKYT